MKHTVIITAGGTGKRMGSEIPKQFLYINDKPILLHTLEIFNKFNPSFEIILTLPVNWIDYWKKLLTKHDIDINHQIVSGGKERFYSIKNAIDLSNGDTISIHDGVRPLVSFNTLKRVFAAIEKNDAVVPCVKIKESIREIDKNKTFSKDRNKVILVQTPQTFKRKLIVEAYKRTYKEIFTDDASLVEENGFKITVVDGNEENIKITSPQDFLLAKVLLKG